MASAAIFDLDNCLSNDMPRIALIDWDKKIPSERYARYHAACGQDEKGNCDLFHVWIRSGVTPVFMTGRPVSVREQTINWLREKFFVHRPILFMRSEDDQRPSVDVKRDQLLSALPMNGIALSNVVAAYDDREDIVAMYRKHGIEAWQLCLHRLDAYRDAA